MRFTVGDIEELVTWKEAVKRTVDTSISNMLKTRLATKASKTRTGKLQHSNHVKDNGESNLDNDMPAFKIGLAGNPNSWIIKINKQVFHAVLDYGDEVSLIHTRVYNSLKEKTNWKNQSVFLQLVKGDSIDVGGCTLLKNKLGSEKGHGFFVVPEINTNSIFGRVLVKQFGVYTYYDFSWIRMSKSYAKMEENIHISSLARLMTQTLIDCKQESFVYA